MIAAITGRLGTGKTAFTTWIAYHSYKDGRAVYSNYKINIPHEPLVHPFQLATIKNGVVVLDQADDWISSIASQRKVQVALSNVYRKYRKMNNDLFVNSQRFMNLHIRLRELCDVQFRMARRPTGGKERPVKYFLAKPCEPYSHVEIYPRIRFYPKDIYHLFDTDGDSYCSETLDAPIMDFLASFNVEEFFAGKLQETKLEELIEER